METNITRDEAVAASWSRQSRDNAVFEIARGLFVLIRPGVSRTIGSGPEADLRTNDPTVAPLHLRIDNRVVYPGSDAGDAISRCVWVVALGSAVAGRTGVVSNPDSGFLMDLDPGEATALRNGAIVVLGDMQLRLVAGDYYAIDDTAGASTNETCSSPAPDRR
jgi:hypothetical protein